MAQKATLTAVLNVLIEGVVVILTILREMEAEGFSPNKPRLRQLEKLVGRFGRFLPEEEKEAEAPVVAEGPAATGNSE